MTVSYKFRVRCVRCDKRRALRHHPKWYLRAPKCTACGNRTYYITPPRGGERCACGGYHFIHRKGSKWCEHARGKITAEEAAARWGGEALDYHWDNHPQIAGISLNKCDF